MKTFSKTYVGYFRTLWVLMFLVVFFGSHPQNTPSKSTALGLIRGVVEDKSGRPISGAIINVFRDGTTRVLLQLKSDSDGVFSTKIFPGKYSLVAVARGFNSSSPDVVQVARAAEVVYRFNLEPVGSGNTVPEKRRDRSDSKWVIRAAQNRRSIFQFSDENKDQTTEVALADVYEPGKSLGQRKGSALETLGGATGSLNFASLHSLSGSTDLLFTGQFSKGPISQSRLEANFLVNSGEGHGLRINTGLIQISRRDVPDTIHSQFNLRVLDEFRLRDDFIFVLGFDYSKLLGEADGSYLSPRIHSQYELNPRTRVNASFRTINRDDLEGTRAISFEGVSAVFIDNPNRSGRVGSRFEQPLQRSNRIEVGVERVLGPKASLDGTLFLDFGGNHLVGLLNIPSSNFGAEEVSVTNSTQVSGASFVYSRNVNSRTRVQGGYAFGRGMSLNSDMGSTELSYLDRDLFHSLFAQIDSDLGSDTFLRTVIRFSPQATIFSVDPFLGRVAVYDPGVSLIVTRILPTMGLPIRAEASLDARNIFDFTSESTSDENTLRFLGNRRMVRGGLLVRF